MSDQPSRLLDTAEGRRLSVATEQGWRRWGTFLSSREWGTVREDYSADGTAWDYLSHDHARSRAYRWGEDGIAGFCDDRQRWCLGLALWNGRDPILKERLFGLTNSEGNHGEDVKELWWNLDGTPTHSFMRMLYRYPQAAFPYERLLEENRRRGVAETEFELIDTGVLDGGRYFDATVEYAKASPHDILIRLTLENPGPEAATLHVLPHLWARNTWSWTENAPRPLLRQMAAGAVMATHPLMKDRRLVIDQSAEWLFCENETNVRRLYGMDAPGHFKDAINDAVVNGATDAVNPLHEGTKCAAHVVLSLPPGGKASIRLRFARADTAAGFDDFDTVMAQRQAEADEFYAVLQHGIADPDARMVQRQALAGMLWTQQWYHLNVRDWLAGDPAQPPPPASRLHGRNSDWRHLDNADIISVPDTWEYPWYAAWDLAFHTVTFALIDPDFAKSQLVLLMREWYMQPDGQFPAYEWAFGDVNPPVHAWAALRVYRMDAALTGRKDRAFLERVFHKLMLNFTWWVNRKDAEGRNIFQGGFLGLDNIGLFDRSRPLPTGGFINQSDGTAWMAMYTLNLLRMALELAADDPVYEDIATKFFEHFLYIPAAMTNIGGEGIGLWDEQDQFFYDVLNLPDGGRVPLRVRSLVGLLPLCAVEVLDANVLVRFPEFVKRMRWMLAHRPDLASLVSHYDQPGKGNRLLLALLRGHRMKALLSRMLDETEFLSPNGIRAVSRYHLDHPYVLEFRGQSFSIGYVPGESNTTVFGGNSNWRGPVWMPINYLLVEALFEFQRYYGDEFQIECPTGSGRFISLGEAGAELGRRLKALFLRGADGTRPVFGKDARLQQDPRFRDYIPFHEYFHGDTGRGLGAAHQTGWTGLVALLLQPQLQTTAGMMPVTHAQEDKEPTS